MTDDTHRPILGPVVNAVIDKLAAAQQHPSNDPRHSRERDPHAYSEYGFSISPDQGDLLCLLCRGLRATRVVEFANGFLSVALPPHGGTELCVKVGERRGGE